jgi:nicotinamidase-related amidase
MTLIRYPAIAIALLLASFGSAFSADIISDWTKAATPPPPELKDVTIDPATTALLLLDIMKENCGVRPRCVAAVATMTRLHDEARARNIVVWYSLVGSNGKATPEDVMDPAIKPRAGEWYRPLGPDKFVGSTLEPTLRQAGVKAIVICGTWFQGATAGTASGAAQRGYRVIVPVDCSAGEDVYREQYATYHLGGGGPAAPTTSR